MTDDINNLDAEDLGLKAVFGARFQDKTEVHTFPKEPVKMPKRESTWEPPAAKKGMTDCLKDGCKWMTLFGGLNLLIFYWSQNGLMAQSIATPCNWICMVLAGVALGKCLAGAGK